MQNKLCYLLILLLFVVLLSCSKKEKPVKTNSETNTIQDTSKIKPTVSDTTPAVDYKVEGKRIEETAVKVADFLKSFSAGNNEKLHDYDRKYIFDSYDLNGDGKYEYLVGLVSTYYCGNAGCTMLVLTSDFRLNSEIAGVFYPIFVSNNDVSNGWKNIYISNSDGYHVLKYSGKKYPSIVGDEPVFNIDNDSSKKQFLKDKMGTRRSF